MKRTQALQVLPALDAAYHVLEASSRPLTAREIVAEARQRGLLKSTGATPWKTMTARLSEDILHKREHSRFMRNDSGLFALRSSRARIHEYVAKRRKINPFDEDILVFDRNRLRDFIRQDGLSRPITDHQSIMGACYPMRRQQAELDHSVIQLVSVFVVSHRRKYATYRRSKRLPESRLHGTYSICFGGHLNPDDLMPLFHFADPKQSLYLVDRELREELILHQAPTAMQFQGLLYDPRSDVSTQHMGLVFNVTLRSSMVEVGERGFLTDLRFETPTQILARIGDFENWSELIIRTQL